MERGAWGKEYGNLGIETEERKPEKGERKLENGEKRGREGERERKWRLKSGAGVVGSKL
jgi:hypothetical protein